MVIGLARQNVYVPTVSPDTHFVLARPITIYSSASYLVLFIYIFMGLVDPGICPFHITSTTITGGQKISTQHYIIGFSVINLLQFATFDFIHYNRLGFENMIYISISQIILENK